MKKQLLGILYGCTKANLLNITVRHFNFVSVDLTGILLLFFSCKNNLEEEDVCPRTGTRTELSIDSFYMPKRFICGMNRYQIVAPLLLGIGTIILHQRWWRWTTKYLIFQDF